MNRRDLMTLGPVAALTAPNEKPQDATFEGWAIVQIMGHQHEAGYVTTVYFGASAMFRIDVPALKTEYGYGWGPTRHVGFPTFLERLRIAWRVFTGEYDAVTWIEPYGEREKKDGGE